VIRIAASILSADFARLGEEVRAVTAAGADWIHLDVMDGHFVPNLTIGPDIVRAVRRNTDLPLDTHLMIDNPGQFLEAFARAGSNFITVHLEVCSDPIPLFRELRRLNVQPGLVINPETPFEAALPYLSEVDLLLVMSVHPGFAAQAFLSETLEKVAAADRYRRERGLGFLIEVDGGIKVHNAGEVAARGADVLVSGSGIFATSDYAATIRAMRQAAERAAAQAVVR
jgi:ribulose-phosphate 3-epimerase